MGIASSKDSKEWKYVLCAKCGKNRATFRAYQMTHNVDDIDMFTQTPILPQPGSILLSEFKNNDDIYPFYATTINTHEQRLTSCNSCATIYVIEYFTYIPDGWKENIMYSEDYERLNKI